MRRTGQFIYGRNGKIDHGWYGAHSQRITAMSDANGSNKILVVEDSLTQAQMVRMVLESEGFTVDVVPSAEAALDKLGDNQYDLVLSDVMMPGMNGYDLCRQIKAQSNGKALPVVLLTALSELKDLVEG